MSLIATVWKSATHVKGCSEKKSLICSSCVHFFFLKWGNITLPFLSTYKLLMQLHNNISVSVCGDSSLRCLACGCSCGCCEAGVGRFQGRWELRARGPEGSQRFHFHIMSPRCHKPSHKIDMFTYNMFRCSFLLCVIKVIASAVLHFQARTLLLHLYIFIIQHKPRFGCNVWKHLLLFMHTCTSIYATLL